MSVVYDQNTNQWVAQQEAPHTVDTSAAFAGNGGLAAALLQQQYAEWAKTYKPVELNLLNQSSLNNPQVVTDAVNTAENTTNQSYNAMAGVEQRQLSSMGIAPTVQQAQASNRMRQLSQSAAVAGADNQARLNVKAQDELIATGSVPSPNIQK